MTQFNWYWTTTAGHSAHWPPSDSVHLVCVCARYRSEYKDSIDHLVCFQATSLPSKASHSTTHARSIRSVLGSPLVYRHKRAKQKTKQEATRTQYLRKRKYNVKSLVDPYTKRETCSLCCRSNIELSVDSRCSTNNYFYCLRVMLRMVIPPKLSINRAALAAKNSVSKKRKRATGKRQT